MILQDVVPSDMRGPTGLPGVRPWKGDTWLHVDEAYAAQMAERARLLDHHPEDVLFGMPEANAAADELLSLVAREALHLGFSESPKGLRRPDGVEVAFGAPMQTLGRLFQNDFVILQKDGAEHVLTAAVLCFPASWMLSEKAGLPLIRIHAPVPEYTPRIATVVQRMFDTVRVGQPLWRFNRLWYADPTLYQPRSAQTPREQAGSAAFMRSERQTIIRLPETQATVFAIHTYVVARDRALEQLEVS